MKQTVNFCDFTDAFRAHDRQDSYSYEGKKALFEYIEQIDEDCGTESELDIIALCCEFSEYPSALECISDCGYDFEPEEDDEEEEQEEAAINYLNDHTMLIQFESGIIIQDF